MGSGFLTAVTAPDVETANAGLYVGVAGVIGTLFTSITPWVRAWFDDRKEERAYRALRLQERLEETVSRLAELEGKGGEIEANTARVAGLDGKVAGALRTLQASGILAGSHDDFQIAPPWPRLLLVEDDPSTARAMSQLFTHLGFDVNHAATVEEAKLILRTRPSWLILDLDLGQGGDGIDLLQLIRDESLPCRVAVTSGVIDPIRLKAIEELRPDAILRKPIAFEDLEKTICIR